MHNDRKPLLNKIPFWVADALLITAAAIVSHMGDPNMTAFECFLFVCLVLLGAICLVIPYYLEFTTYAKLHRNEHDKLNYERVRKMDMSIEALAEARKQFEGVAVNRNDGEAFASFETRIGVMELHINDIHERSTVALRAFNQTFLEQIGSQKQVVDKIAEKIDIVAVVVNKPSETFPDIESFIQPLQSAVKRQEQRIEGMAEQLRAISVSVMTVKPEVDLSPLKDIFETRIADIERAIHDLREELENGKQSAQQAPQASRSRYGQSSLLSKAFINNPPSETASAIERIIKSDTKRTDEAFVEEDDEVQLEGKVESLANQTYAEQDAFDIQDEDENGEENGFIPEDMNDSEDTDENEEESIHSSITHDFSPDSPSSLGEYVFRGDASDSEIASAGVTSDILNDNPQIEEEVQTIDVPVAEKMPQTEIPVEPSVEPQVIDIPEEVFFADKRPTLKDIMSVLETTDDSDNSLTDLKKKSPVGKVPVKTGFSDGMLDLGIFSVEARNKKKLTTERNNLGQTRITVHAMIGIGNKPYIRGDGPGLNWERGVPMEFVEIGKWEWKTMRAHETFKYQVWLNDQKPADGDIQTAEPEIGAQLSPRFTG